MILVDTSIWIGHLRASNGTLVGLLEGGDVLTHPWVIGELALGRPSDVFLDALSDLPLAVIASDDEVLGLIRRNRLYGQGIGYVDAQLLAAARLTEGAKLWTGDRRLAAVAERLGLSASPLL